MAVTCIASLCSVSTCKKKKIPTFRHFPWMWILLRRTASVCTWRKAVYWSCLWVPFGKGIEAPLEATPHLSPLPCPQEGLQTMVGFLGETQVIPAILPFTWPSCFSGRRSAINLGPSSLLLLLPFKCVKSWGLPMASQSEALCTSGSTLFQFSFLSLLFFFQSVSVTAIWNHEENGINMLETLESDLQLFICHSFTSWAYFEAFKEFQQSWRVLSMLGEKKKSLFSNKKEVFHCASWFESVWEGELETRLKGQGLSRAWLQFT